MSRKKPKTPEQIAAEKLAARRQDMAAVNLHGDAASLKAHDDVQITRAGANRYGRKVQNDSARRLDAFEALKSGMQPGCYDAARRLERDILMSLDLAASPNPIMDRVDCERGRTDFMMLARTRVIEVRGKLPDRDYWLLHDLIAPSIDRGNWRAHVAYITGETHDHAQGAAVRAACVNLRDCYLVIDGRIAA